MGFGVMRIATADSPIAFSKTWIRFSEAPIAFRQAPMGFSVTRIATADSAIAFGETPIRYGKTPTAFSDSRMSCGETPIERTAPLPSSRGTLPGRQEALPDHPGPGMQPS